MLLKKSTYSFPQNMFMKNKRVIENEASVARPASPQSAPYVQGIAVAQALLPVRLAFVPNAQGNSRGFPTPGRFDGRGGGGRSGAGRASPKKRCYSMTNEAGMCMKTNRKVTPLPRRNTTFLHILHKSTRILPKPAVFLSLLKCSGTNPALQM